MKRLLSFFTLFLLVLAFSQCSKPKLYGTLQENSPIERYYNVSPQKAYQAAKESLAYLGYSLREDNEQSKSLQTHWQPTTSDSHYVEVFNRKDFGTVGAYYYLAVNVIPRGQGSVVTLRNVAKSVISNLKSSRREETRFFGKMADFTRAKDIEVTNIGLQ